jgi:hypothetical protein
MAAEMSPDRNARIIDEFHANEGRIGGYFEGHTLLLLHNGSSRSLTALRPGTPQPEGK